MDVLLLLKEEALQFAMNVTPLSLEVWKTSKVLGGKIVLGERMTRSKSIRFTHKRQACMQPRKDV